MIEVILSTVDASDLSVLRAAVADASATVYGAKIRYAEGLNMSFGVLLGTADVFDAEDNVVDIRPEVSGWFDCEHKALPLAVAAEKAAFYAALKGGKHSNPSKVWADVRAYGRKAALVQAEAICMAAIKSRDVQMPEGTERSSPLAAPSKGANDKRSIKLRMMEDLVGLYKAAKREKNLASNEVNALVHIVSALEAMGVDLTTLAK